MFGFDPIVRMPSRATELDPLASRLARMAIGAMILAALIFALAV
jgi:hypothetical protein